MMKTKPFVIATVSLLFYYLALPPINLPFLAFISPILWVFLIKTETSAYRSEPKDKSPNRKKGRFFRMILSYYGQLSLASLLFWLISLIWLPSPHPAIWICWFLLSAAMAPYFPLFIAVSKRLSEYFHFPLLLATPIAWVGAEWYRKHILSGFSLCSLEHAFYRHPVMIQTAEFGGEYTVGALIVLIGTAWGIGIDILFFSSSPNKKWKNAFSAFLSGILVLAGMVSYGFYRMGEIEHLCNKANTSPNKSVRISLLQDPTYYKFPVSSELCDFVHESYMSLSFKTARNDQPDLIVWPEGTFAHPFFDFEPNAKLPVPEGIVLSPEEEKKEIKRIQNRQNNEINQWVKTLESPVLIGLSSTVYSQNGSRTYNSALYCEAEKPFKRYDKRARVMFGEYIPLLENLPESFPLKTLCEPISSGIHLGDIPLGKYTALVSICFESCYTRFVRSQLDELAQEGKNADFLINISNDAWFFGGIENEHHAATYPFRGVETRKYYLVATHGGTSCALTPAGKLFAQGTKGKPESILVEFTPTNIKPFLNGKGLWVNVLCALLCLLLFVPPNRKKAPHQTPQSLQL